MDMALKFLGGTRLRSSSKMETKTQKSRVAVVDGNTRPAYSVVKRVFDITAAAGALLIFSPNLCMAAVLVRLNSEGPIFYMGVRAGKNGVPFEMIKFRTMVINADKIGGP